MRQSNLHAAHVTPTRPPLTLQTKRHTTKLVRYVYTVAVLPNMLQRRAHVRH